MLEVGEDVVDVLGADGEADGVGVDAAGTQLLLGELGVRGGSGVDDEALDVSHVGEQAEELEALGELLGRLCVALDLEGEDGRGAVGIIAVVELLGAARGQARVVHALHLRVVVEELDDLEGVLHVALDAQGKRLQTLEQQERVERRQRCTLVAQKGRAGLGDVRGRAARVGEHDAVVGGVRLGQAREAVGMRCPVELAGIHNHAAHDGAVSAHELGGRVDHDVGAVLDGTQQVGRGERGVHDERQAVTMGDLGPTLEVKHVGVGVAERLGIEQLGVGLDGGLNGGEVVGTHEGGGEALLNKRVAEEVHRAAVQVGGGHDVVAGRCDVLHGNGDGSRAAGHAKRTHTALERRDALLKDRGSGVGEARVDVAGLRKGKAAGRRGGILEHVGRGGVNRDRAGIGGGVGAFLAGMGLEGLETVSVLGVGHRRNPFGFRIAFADMSLGDR